MTSAILKGYNSLVKSAGNTDFAIVPPRPYLHSHTKIKRWWNSSYDKVTYTECALISYRDSYIVVSCDVNVLVKIIADNNNQLDFNVIFKNQGDGGIRRILVCPKVELYDLVNYDDYYYDYTDKQIKKVTYGDGGLDIDLFKTASLDLEFATNKSLVDSVSGDNLITFSRASSGTYVGSDGLIKTSPVNYATNSEDVNLWTLTSGSVSANFAESPIGDQTADKWIPGTGTAYHYTRLTTTLSSTSSVTYSIYAKQAGYRYLLVNTSAGSSSGNAGPLVDLQDGVVVDNFTATYPTTVTDAGNGWWRIAFTYTGNGTNLSVDHNPFPTSTVATYAGDGTSGVLLWGAQLEEGTTATDYIPTGATISGAPRFDHDPVTGESLGLLIEEGRTNLAKYSEPDDRSTNNVSGEWHFSDLDPHTKITKVEGPDGVSNSASEMQLATGSSYDSSLRQVPVTSSQSYTFSAWVKLGTATNFALNVNNTSLLLADGAYSFDANDGLNTNSFVKVSHTFVAPSTGAVNAHIGKLPVTGAAQQTQGTVTVWGCQLEQGAFSSSTIITNGSTVTRSPDIATIEGNKFAKTNLLSYSERFDQSAWTKHLGASIIPNATISPDGSQTADKQVGGNQTNWFICTQFPTVAVNGVYTGSIYAKAAGFRYLRVYDSMGTNQYFDLDTGNTPGMEDVGNGWYRCPWTVTATGTVYSYRLYVTDNNTGAQPTGDGVKGIYIWGAQLEEGSELTEYTPSVETFVSRASSATYVDDATGLIKTTPVNEWLHSEDVSSWNRVNTTIDSNNALAPDGTQTADKVNFSNTTTDWSIVYQGNYTGTYTWSGWIKTDDNSTKDIYLTWGTPDPSRVRTFTATGEWQRFEAVVTPSHQNIHLGNARVEHNISPQVWAGGQFYVWGAQLEANTTTASPYIKTGSTISGAARYENGELLLEPARTNLSLYGRQFDAINANSWLPINGGAVPTIAADTHTAPDGTSSGVYMADTIAGATGTAFNGNVVRQLVTIASSVKYTFSLYIKLLTATQASIYIRDGTTGSVSSSSTQNTQGWQRVVVTSSANLSSSVNSLYIGNTNGTIAVWGSQLEAAPYASSYIPTTGSTVTRAADVSTSALGVDSWYNQSEGTFYGQASKLGANNNARLFITSTGSSTRTTDVYRDTPSTQLALRSSTVYLLYGGYTEPLTVTAAYKANDYAGSLNGVLAFTGGSGSVLTCDRLTLGNYYTGSYYANGHITRLAYFPTRKTDQELIDLTIDNTKYPYGSIIKNYPYDLGQLPNPVTKRIDIEIEYGLGAVYDLNPIN
ncbi:MAG: hypothetical protein CMJ25_25855 [Phycisphaerae bacterium]|nr:hypothetical protein [Phycisphaerae bacterium]|tara:strand:+ start:1970 stop:5854 length:3885 start_codon:yes stop_codon:yes gene_type:complete